MIPSKQRRHTSTKPNPRYIHIKSANHNLTAPPRKPRPKHTILRRNSRPPVERLAETTTREVYGKALRCLFDASDRIDKERKGVERKALFYRQALID